MIFIAGAGAMADAAAAMRRQQRELNRRFSRTRQRLESRWVYKLPDDYEPERTDFPCAFLCGRCDYFLRPAEVDLDEVDDEEELAPDCDCPACGSGEWIDLSVKTLAARLRDVETQDRQKPPKFVKQLVLVGGIALFSVVTFAMLIAGATTGEELFGPPYSFYALFTVCAGLFLIPVAYRVLPRPLSVMLLRNQQRMPHRWHVPLDLPAPGREPTKTLRSVKPEAVDETITAPISGRECLACEVCVLFDAPGDARPPEWALQEQQSVAIRLDDGRELASEEFYLESPVEEVDAPSGFRKLTGPDVWEDDERYEEIKQFLRQRGLFSSDGSFYFYESRLEPGDEVDIADYDGGMYILTHSEGIDTEGLPALPRP